MSEQLEVLFLKNIILRQEDYYRSRLADAYSEIRCLKKIERVYLEGIDPENRFRAHIKALEQKIYNQKKATQKLLNRLKPLKWEASNDK